MSRKLTEKIKKFVIPTDNDTPSDPKPINVSKRRPRITRINFLFFLIGFFTSGLICLALVVNIDLIELKSFEYDTINEQQIKLAKKGEHKLAIVVPFRDRFDELQLFVPHISKFLIQKKINFDIYIVNKIDKYRFNRASLINVGFLASMTDCDYMAMHDIDLLPLNDFLDYSYPKNGPFHVSAPGLHPDYNYTTFIGGILIVKKEHFLATNGMSSRYWGWGKEVKFLIFSWRIKFLLNYGKNNQFL
jgi:xylosylprotein 4-beta-galactosyltransferase